MPDFDENIRGGGFYDRQQEVSMHEDVERFLIAFQNSIMYPDTTLEYDEQINDIQDHYENTWNKLSDKYYKGLLWPSADDVGNLFYQRDIEFTDEFRILYTELYYRHAYTALGSGKANQHASKPDQVRKMMYQRFNSWENYVEFFNLIINCKEVPRWTLPAQWLWDIMDEFIYQFGQYRQYRSKMGNKTPEEVDYLEQHGEALWAIHSVLNVLHSIVDKSAIVESLTIYTKSKNEGTAPDNIHIDEFGHSLMYKYLGYFSLIGLLRFHVLIGDYQLAVDSIKAIPIELLYDLNDNEWFITTHYYYSFALIMMKRYHEAIKRLQDGLNFIERNRAKTGGNRVIQYKVDQQNKQIEQLYHILAIGCTMYPIKIDDSIEEAMRNKVGDDKLSRLNDGDQKVYEDIYGYVAPKFVPLGSPPLDSNKAVNFANANLQKKVFMDEVRSQLQLPAIRRYLKLYTTMELSKLTSFLSKSAGFTHEHSNNTENATLSYLMCCKTKMALASGEDFNKTCPSTSKLVNMIDDEKREEWWTDDSTGPKVDFYVDGKMVHIADTEVEKTYGKSFMKLVDQYHKIETQVNNIGRKGHT